MRIKIAFLLSALSSVHSSAAFGEEFVLQMPLDCKLNDTCFVQQFVDHDKTSSAKDYGCGAATYDGHKGTDFRLENLIAMDRGVNVLAAAAGQVVALRDDMPDKIMLTADDKAAVKGKECGNGLVITHKNGYQTQYCHLKYKSITVNNYDYVEAGQVLGEVGASGSTQFPHLHIGLTKNRRVIDPFAPDREKETCNYTPSNTLWDAKFQNSYDAEATKLITYGFAPGPVSFKDSQAGTYAEFIPASQNPALVAFVGFINIRTTDRIDIKVTGPNGLIVGESKGKGPDRPKSRYLRFAGKKKPKQGWPKGAYNAKVILWRGNDILIEKSFQTAITD